MKYWLMKSEPDVYGIAHLKKEGSTVWDGVRNYQVRNMLRDDFSPGDKALFYHSNAGKETGVVGVMEVVSDALPDPSQFDAASEYYDPKATKPNPTWLTRRMKYIETFSELVTLEELRKARIFAGSPLIQKGNRLSIIPVSKSQFEFVCKRGRV